MKPISRSTASAIPPVLPASRHDWTIAPASMKLRKLSTSGNPAQVDRAAGAAGLHREQQRREDEDRRGQLRPAKRLLDRPPARAPLTTRRLAASEPGIRPRPRLGGRLVALDVLAGLGDEDVVEGRLDQVERLDQDSGLVEGADDLGDVAGAAVELDQDLAVALRQRAAERRADPLGVRRRAVDEPDLEVRLADLGLERRRRALGDDLAARR